jgi:hypothetical protein
MELRDRGEARSPRILALATAALAVATLTSAGPAHGQPGAPPPDAPPPRTPRSLRSTEPDEPLLTPPTPPSLVRHGADATQGAPPPAAPSFVPPPPRPERAVKFLFRMSVEFGGDVFAAVTGGTDHTVELRAGSMLAIGAGAAYHFRAPFTLEATIGFKVEGEDYDNGLIEFDRFPLEVIGAWSPGRFRLGLGATVHFAPRIRCHLDGVCDEDVSFDNALGWIAQIAYDAYHGDQIHSLVALRYTRITYTSASAPPLDGSCVGLSLAALY